ncbi:DUF2785 domain-containing protein [Nocardioides convexus]|uniref:DUF2785 domain-containing protein n=1 Tax=Nocardioides convexus TaxID=2712224 RepID=UPI00241821C9|nr:DUF2785 domain-containing protein [Nocardioides convexus]
MLAECIDRDTRVRRQPQTRIMQWGDRLAAWYVRERDLRGFVPGKGWAHAAANGADALGALARSPYFGATETHRAARRGRRPGPARGDARAAAR